MMKHFSFIAATSLLLILGLTVPAFSQVSFKIGVIDTQLVLEEYERAKIAMTKLDKERDRLRAKGQELVDQLRDMQEKLGKSRKFLDEEQVTQTENDLRIKQTEIESFTTTAQETLDDMQQTMFDPVIEEVETYILDLGKRENYAMLLRKQLTVLYVKPEFDLTERVIKELNEQYAKRQVEKSPKPAVSENVGAEEAKETATPEPQK